MSEPLKNFIDHFTSVGGSHDVIETFPSGEVNGQ